MNDSLVVEEGMLEDAGWTGAGGGTDRGRYSRGDLDAVLICMT